MRLSQKDKKAIRDAAKISAVIITCGEKDLITDYGRKTQEGVANIFLHQLELQLELVPGTIQDYSTT